MDRSTTSRSFCGGHLSERAWRGREPDIRQGRAPVLGRVTPLRGNLADPFIARDDDRNTISKARALRAQLRSLLDVPVRVRDVDRAVFASAHVRKLHRDAVLAVDA